MEQQRRRGWGTVAVAGRSMVPLLRPGDWLVVWWWGSRRGSRIRVGQVVVARRPDHPGLLVIKTVARRAGPGWWLVGQNLSGSDDSRVFGAVDEELILGRAVARYWPAPRWL
ncbi:MAG: nickel-type superoxide dismutase maturation protease [Actinomycetes bacterium]